MPFPTRDDFKKRRTFEESDGTAYQRTYNVSIDIIADGGLPVEGDMMPGTASALLGPFISRNGIAFGKQTSGGFQDVILKCKKLSVKSGESGAYQELTGRGIVKTPSTVVYTTFGIAATEDEATAPVEGDLLSGINAMVAPICSRVDIDRQKYPQRFLFTAQWEGGVTRPEFLSG